MLLGLICTPEIDELSFVEDTDLVEEFVKGFAGLIEGNDSRKLVKVSRNPESPGELESGGGIETTS